MFWLWTLTDEGDGVFSCITFVYPRFDLSCLDMCKWDLLRLSQCQFAFLCLPEKLVKIALLSLGVSFLISLIRLRRSKDLNLPSRCGSSALVIFPKSPLFFVVLMYMSFYFSFYSPVGACSVRLSWRAQRRHLADLFALVFIVCTVLHFSSMPCLL